MLQNYNKVLILDDQIKNLKLNNLPNNLLLNKNDAYILALKQMQFEMTYCVTTKNTTAWIPLKEETYTKILINWGDNTPTSTYMYNASLTGSYASSNYYLSHVYTEPKLYNILIAGDFKGLNNLSSSILQNHNFSSLTGNFLYNGIISTNIELSGKDYKTDVVNYYLYSINSWGNIPFETLKNFCINASGLQSIPNTELPNVNDCSNMFYNCINLKNGFDNNINNMSSFQLPFNAVNCQNMFKNTEINYDFSKLSFPFYLTTVSGMFENTNITNLNILFYNSYLTYIQKYPSDNQLLSSHYYKCLPANFPSANLVEGSQILTGYINGKLVNILTGQKVK